MRRIRRSAEEWKQILEDFEKSEISAEEYCKEKEYSESSLYAWQRRLNPKKPKETPGSGFVQIAPASKMCSKLIRIETPNGYRIDFPCETEGLVLKNILPILMAG